MYNLDEIEQEIAKRQQAQTRQPQMPSYAIEDIESEIAKRQNLDTSKRKGIQKELSKSLTPSGLLKSATGEQAQALGRGALEGATLGFASRVAPAISAGVAKVTGGKVTKDIPFSELYSEARGIYKKEKVKAREEYPIAAIGGEIAGAIASPANILGGGISRGLGGGIKGIVGAAAAEGAVAGAGYTEDLTKTKEVLKDIGTGAVIGSVAGGALYGAGKAVGTVTKPISKIVKPRLAAARKIKSTIKKEGGDMAMAFKQMDDEGLALIDVLDNRSALVSSLPKKTYEKATIDTVDNYVNTLNKAGSKAKVEVLDMISKNKITPDEGAELLGRNAQEVINRQMKIRTDKAKIFYDKAFSRKKNVIRKSDEILKRPVVEEAIDKVRSEADKFGDTTIGNIKDLPDNSLPVLHQAKQYLYRKSKDFTDIESARYKQVYNELNNKLKKASPNYKKANDIWAGETEGLEQLYKQKGIGNIAKKYANNDLDGIKSNLKNVFNKTTSNEELARIKSSMNPKEFNSIVRKDLSSLLDDAGDKGSNFKNVLFGKGDTAESSLKNKRLNLLFNREQKSGLRKMADSLDRAKLRAKDVEKVRFGDEALTERGFPITRYGILNKISDFSTKLLERPAYRDEYVKILTSNEGKKILSELQKANKKESQQIILRLVNMLDTQIQQTEE